MEFGGASSIVLLLAVGLWTAYFVPSWVRRRNYLATERNAVRMQQALRALAETSEIPDEVRVSTSARDVAEQRRKLKRARSEAEQAERERVAAAERNLPVVPAPRNADDRRRQAKATRRGRLLASGLLIAGLAAAGFGVHLGLTVANWWVLVAGTVGVLVALAALQRLARVAGAQRLAAERQISHERTPAAREVVAVSPTAQTMPIDLVPAAPVETVVDEPAPVAGWTPVSVPRPLYLSRTSVESAPTDPQGPDGPGGGEPFGRSQLEALRAAARASEQAIRDAHRQTGVATFGTPRVASAEGTPRSSADLESTQPLLRATASSAPVIEPITAPEGDLTTRGTQSRWARMGVVGEGELDERDSLLGRRRAG